MKRIVTGQHVVDWVAERLECELRHAVGFGIEQNGTLIAGLVFNDYNGVNIHMHVASDGSKRWLTKEFLWLVFDYAFNQAKVNRITITVPKSNTVAVEFDEHIGLVYEATLVGAHPTGDLLLMRMFRKDCRWLNMRVRHEYLKAA